MDYLNVIVDNGNQLPEDSRLFFSPEGMPAEEVIWVQEDTTIYDLLVQIGAFSSKSQAKKNWHGPTSIPTGYSEFRVGKLRRHLCILNPTKTNS